MCRQLLVKNERLPLNCFKNGSPCLNHPLMCWIGHREKASKKFLHLVEFRRPSARHSNTHMKHVIRTFTNTHIRHTYAYSHTHVHAYADTHTPYCLLLMRSAGGRSSCEFACCSLAFKCTASMLRYWKCDIDGGEFQSDELGRTERFIRYDASRWCGKCRCFDMRHCAVDGKRRVEGVDTKRYAKCY